MSALKIKTKDIYIYVLLFICIYVEFGYCAVIGNYLSGSIRSIILLFATLPALFLYKSMQTSKSILFLTYTFIALILSRLRDSSTGDYLLLLLPLGIGYIIATRIPIKDTIISFCNIVYYLTIYSLFVYLICALIPPIARALPFINYFHDSQCTMHDAFFSVVISGANFPRNFGITWEPGAFAILIGVATFCSIFFYSEINKKRIAVFALGIISTFSTMGYVLMAAMFLSFFTIKKSSNKGLIVISFILVIVTMQIPFMQELTFGKLEGLTNSSVDVNETTTARIDAIVYPGMAFLNNPIMGVGYDKFKFINTVLCNNVATNTIVNWFAIFGLLLGIPFTYFYLHTISTILEKKVPFFNILFILFSAILMISTESLLRISLIYYIIFLSTINYKYLNICIRG